MKRIAIVLTVLSSFALMPLIAFASDCCTKSSASAADGPVLVAMSHEDHSDHKMMDHGSMDHSKMDHDSMQMQGGMIMLGEKEEDGVKANMHMKDVGEAMAKMGMNTTHHFMVILTDTKSGKTIEEGVVAVKIKGPSGEEGKPIKLMGMQGHFGADVTLAEPGEYHFTVATKLADGKTRKFEAEFKK